MHWIVALVLFATGDVLGPTDYLLIMTGSKLRYDLNAAPSKTPIEPRDCPRRDVRLRRVAGKLVPWKVPLEALNFINAGDDLYQKKDYDGAMAKYRAGLAIDPEAPLGYFFLGDALLIGKKDAAAALEQYRKGIALDPSVPTGHFFAQSALVELGRNDEAREEIIRALTYYPSYESVWKAAAVSEERWKIKPIVRHKFEPPAGFLGGNAKDGIDVYGGPKNEWLPYAMCKALWANEPRFSKDHVPDGWSLEEERACVMNQVMGAYAMAKKNVAKMPPLERHLWDVAEANLLDGYILFEIIGQHCPMAMSTMSDDGVKDVDAYLRKYVIVAR